MFALFASTSPMTTRAVSPPFIAHPQARFSNSEVKAKAQAMETPACDEFDSRFIKKTYVSQARKQRRDRDHASQEF